MLYILTCTVAAAVYGDRVSPALVKVVAGPGGQGELLQPAVFKGAEGGASVAGASSWALLSWVETENYGLVSELSPENFSMCDTFSSLCVRRYDASRLFLCILAVLFVYGVNKDSLLCACLRLLRVGCNGAVVLDRMPTSLLRRFRKIGLTCTKNSG